ncbi:hypothetical protein [Haloferula sp. BvORR071]|uniref:hypothetical protein n=1 Tax=Haloferula sp. BvORR071 TaxID=1396141 RepID=UPI0005543598|nr:hypothetical protein [Haloferula sp. BvORR071]
MTTTQAHNDSLRLYLNDMIAVERDIANAVRGQLGDDRVQGHIELSALLDRIVTGAESRIARLKELSKEEGGQLGATIKEGVTAVTGSLAGVYDKFRQHPLSRMVRDDIAALDVLAISYSMLLTLGLAAGHAGTAILAEEGLKDCPPIIVALTGLLPVIVAQELSADAPLANPAAAQVAQAAIREAWQVSCG